MPEIGEEAHRPRTKRHISAVDMMYLIVVAITLVSSFAAVRFENNSPDNLPSKIQAETSYVAHDPIVISGDAAFTGANGVARGSGTELDPYVIEGWEIDAWDKHGIVIGNTDAHFIIRNCRVYEGFNAHKTGIILIDCANGTLDGNICPDNWIGILLSSSEGNTIINNNCSWNDNVNLKLFNSSGNTIRNNIFSWSMYGDGIELYSSSNNTLIDNNCSSSYLRGISLADSSCDNDVIGNQICDNYGHGVSIASFSSNNTIWNNTFVGNNDANNSYNAACVQAFDEGTGNIWNTSGMPHGYGNYWSDWTSPDSNMDGIVDAPYEIDGVEGAKDWCPLTPPAHIPQSPASSSVLAMIMVTLAAVVIVVLVAILVVSRKNKGAVAPSSSAQASIQPVQSQTYSTGTQRFCSYCGGQVAPGAVRCSKCGRNL